MKARRVNDNRIEADTDERQRFFLGDPAGLGTKVPADERGVAGAVCLHGLAASGFGIFYGWLCGAEVFGKP